jgi:hypothetical protein
MQFVNRCEIKTLKNEPVVGAYKQLYFASKYFDVPGHRSPNIVELTTNSHNW